MLEILIQQKEIVTEGLKMPTYLSNRFHWQEVLEGIEQQIELLTVKQAA